MGFSVPFSTLKEIGNVPLCINIRRLLAESLYFIIKGLTYFLLISLPSIPLFPWDFWGFYFSGLFLEEVMAAAGSYPIV